jgi:DNA-binding beta-propeller fold protein YncE
MFVNPARFPSLGSRKAVGRRRRLPNAREFRPALETLERRAVLSAFEVWAMDQSNTRDENGNGSVLDSVDSGGTLYIYRAAELQGHDADRADPEVIDLGGAARDLSVAQTGTAPIRPHMMYFNSTRSHAIVSFVASGHVLFMDSASRVPLAVIDVGVQAHAAIPAPDDSYVIVANQNGKLLQRIWTNYATNTFTLDPVPLDLASGTTPSGAPRQDPILRPDNAPICGVIDPASRLTFVTLRGGGLFVVDSASPTLSIVNEYDRATIHHDGCGGVVASGKIYLNSGGPGEADLYSFDLADFDTLPDPPNSPERTLVFRQGGDPNLVQADSHGATLTRHGRYLWVADRWANKIVVVDTRTDQIVNEIELPGRVSSDPAPDLLATSPDGNRVFVALRGPRPLTANNPTFNNAVGNTPGLGVIQVTLGGRGGKLIAVAPVSHVVAGLERADVHGIGIRTIHGRKHAAHDGLALSGSALLMHGSPGGQDLAAAAIPSQTLLTESPWSRSSPIGKSVVATHDAPQPLPELVIDLLLTPKDSQDQDLLEELSQLSNLDEDLSLADLLFPANCP